VQAVPPQPRQPRLAPRLAVEQPVLLRALAAAPRIVAVARQRRIVSLVFHASLGASFMPADARPGRASNPSPFADVGGEIRVASQRRFGAAADRR
jgi:hypothetical protein